MLSALQTIVRPRRAPANPIPALAAEIASIVQSCPDDENRLCAAVAEALGRVIESADWIPPALLVPKTTGYRRELLHEAADGSFAIGCFTWGAGQKTPIHDHHSWGVVGAVIGALEAVSFYPTKSGGFVAGPVDSIETGTCNWLHPEGGDIHRIGSASDETVVSIHVYGCRFDRVCRNKYHPDGTVMAA